MVNSLHEKLLPGPSIRFWASSCPKNQSNIALQTMEEMNRACTEGDDEMDDISFLAGSSGAYRGFKLSLTPPSGEFGTLRVLWTIALPFIGGAVISFVFVAAPLGWDSPPGVNNFWVFAYCQQFLWDLAAYFMLFTIINAGLPGMPKWLKITTHSFGVAIPLIYRTVFHILDMDDNVWVNTFCILITANFPIFLFYLIHTLVYAKVEQRTGLPVLDVYTGAYWLEGNKQVTCLFRSPIRQYFLIIVFLSIFASVYAALEMFTLKFEDAVSSQKPFWYAAFVIINLLYKDILKGLAMVIDAGKSGTFSLFFYAELIVLVNYFSFYRVLFDSLKNSFAGYLVFVALQVVHVAHEWAFYPIRATLTYYDWYRSAVKGLAEWQSTALDALLAPLTLKLVFSYKDWASFVTLDYGLRVCIALFTAAFYLTCYSFIRYGWNKDHFDYYAETNDTVYRDFVTFICLSCAIEIINTAVIEYFFLKPRQLSISLRLFCLFSNTNFSIAAALVIGTLFCNVWLVNTIMVFSY